MNKLASPFSEIKNWFLHCGAPASSQERDRRIAELAASDPELASEIRLMLEASEQSSVVDQVFHLTSVDSTRPSIASGSPVGHDSPLGKEASIADAPLIVGLTTCMDLGNGSSIGRYRIIRQLGEGGMGTVFQAEQTEPIHREVALKIIKSGFDTEQVVSRFEQERQTLAMMDHPSIAKVLDAGATDQGLPYFVMELVDGIPITEYCKQQNQNMREKLTLFVRVCRGVQHAHQQRVIHRDLKPSNLLVAAGDDAPHVKIIDFGIAYAIDRDSTALHQQNNDPQVIGTPLYMSPEQMNPKRNKIDTRSDVYALGVVLYQLLSGTLPFDQDTCTSHSTEALLQKLGEFIPPRPSLRGGEPVPSELDWIVMRAMHKDRDQRYESAGALARDIERYLSGDPVEAYPSSLTYRVGKLAAKSRGVVASVIALLIVLVVSTAVSVSYAIQADRAMQEARTQRDAATKAEAVAQKNLEQSNADLDIATRALDAFIDEAASPEFAQLPGLRPVRDRILNDAIGFYETIIAEHGNDTRSRERYAVALRTVSKLHLRLGHREQQIELLNRAVERMEELILEHPQNESLKTSLASILFERIHSKSRSPNEQLADAENAIELVAKNSREFHNPEFVALLYYKVAERISGNTEKATAMIEKAAQTCRDNGIPEIPSIYQWRGTQAATQRRWDEAIIQFQNAIVGYEQLSEQTDIEEPYLQRLLASQVRLEVASVYENANQLDHAEESHRLAFSQMKSIYGNFGQDIRVQSAFQKAARALGAFLIRQERGHDAVKFFDDLVNELPDSADAHFVKAQNHSRLEQGEQALRSFEKAVTIRPTSVTQREFAWSHYHEAPVSIRDIELALKHAKIAVAIRSTDVRALNVLAEIALHDCHDLLLAERTNSQAVTLAPTNQWALQIKEDLMNKLNKRLTPPPADEL